MRTTDNLVIGAGTVGAFATHALAEAGEDVLVVDRKDPGLEAAGLNAGTLAVQNKPIDLVPLAMRGADAWAEFEERSGRDLHYVRCGGFRVAHTEAGAARLQRDAREQRAAGLQVTHLSGDEARERAPYLSPDVRTANWCPHDGHNNALTAVWSVIDDAVQRGARRLPRTAVTRLERADGVWHATTAGEPIRARRVFVAAGLWSRDLAATVGLDVPLEPRNNQMMVSESVPRFIDHVVTHVSGRLTLKQKSAGTVLIGGGWPGRHDLVSNRKWPDLGNLVGNARLAIATVPALATIDIVRTWAGLDGRTQDENPVIGPVEGLPGLYLATSCRAAYTLGPPLGQGVVTWALSGHPPPLLAPFAERGTYARVERAALRGTV